jgi:hypothetical protein
MILYIKYVYSVNTELYEVRTGEGNPPAWKVNTG